MIREQGRMGQVTRTATVARRSPLQRRLDPGQLGPRSATIDRASAAAGACRAGRLLGSLGSLTREKGVEIGVEPIIHRLCDFGVDVVWRLRGAKMTCVGDPGEWLETGNRGSGECSPGPKRSSGWL